MSAQWILRSGTKASGFRYARESGAAVRDARSLERIRALGVPPAWRDVHVAVSPKASIQAWGFDAKGRKQYRYHPEAVEQGSLRKFYRVRQLARDLPTIRAQLRKDFASRGMTKRRVSAGVVRLIGEAFFRVGNERYAEENRTFGVSTMQKRHVEATGDTMVFDYVGKRSIRHRQTVVSAELARFVRALIKTPGKRLFRYQAADGRWADLDARDVNAYLHDLVGVPYTAKDFRTWGGTLRAATILADIGPADTPREAKRNVVTAVRLVAAELGNTPTIARKSYVHPIVLSKYQDEGETIRPRRAAGETPAGHTAEERALIAFLNRHFPERRKRKDRRRRSREADERRELR